MDCEQVLIFAESLSPSVRLTAFSLKAVSVITGAQPSTEQEHGCTSGGIHDIYQDSMRYVMKQKLFCWGEDFCIKNEAGEEVFFVDGKAFSFDQHCGHRHGLPRRS